MSKYLDVEGVASLWAKIKNYAAKKSHASQHASGGSDQIYPADIGAKPASELRYTMYRSLEELGLTGAVTVADVCNAMPAYTMVRFANGVSGTYITDAPASYGTVEIWRVYTNYYEARWVAANNSANVYVGTYHTTSGFSGWVSFLPLNGGTMTGALTVKTSSEVQMKCVRTVSNNEYQASVGVGNYASGGAIAFDLFDTDDLANVLAQVYITQTSGIRYRAKGSTSYKALYGEHNKPAGEYVGNGSETQTRTVNTGGTGNVLVIWRRDEGGVETTGIVIATPSGAVSIHKSNLFYLNESEVKYVDGTLTFKSTDANINSLGYIFKYQCL